jgi:uncharacterized protein YjdB
MRKIIHLLALLCSTNLLLAQGTLHIGSGAHFVVSGAAQVVMDTGNFVNNGNYYDSSGTFVGVGGINFTGSGITKMNKLLINNTRHSTINTLVSVYENANLAGGYLDANGLLYIRSDINDGVRMFVTGVLTNNIQGLLTMPSVTSGPCPSYTSELKTNILGPAVLYQWQTSADGTTWTDIPGATSGTYLRTVTSTQYCRAHVTTNNSTYSQHTPAVLLTMSGVVTPITGPTSVCVGTSTITLSNATPGGAWSNPTGNVSINSMSGILNGISAGTSLISYTLPSGCAATYIITVNEAPAAISGLSYFCEGEHVTFSNTTPGGIWTTSNTAVATIASGGNLTTVTPGTVTVSYTLGTGCYATKNITIEQGPGPVSGNLTVCEGSSSALSATGPGVVWNSSAMFTASISSTGLLTGLAPGTSTIVYTAATGCARSVVATVLPLPDAITGEATLCTSGTSLFATTSTGGVWSSAAPAVATVNASGLVSAASIGTATISYTLPTGCAATRVASVSPATGNIFGTTSLCIGATTTLTTEAGTGTWTSSTPSVATIDGAGLLTGIASGTATITFTYGAGCHRTRVVTINSLPADITGATNVCIGATIPLTSAPAGGVWSSNTPSVATISASGVVTGVAAGSSVITYSNGAGCYRTFVVDVNTTPAIIGTLFIAPLDSTILGGLPSGGSWSSSNTAVATVSPVGTLVGVAPGTSNITYTLSGGCPAVVQVTVNNPGITGNAKVCVGQTTDLDHSVSGGTWSSTNTGRAVVDAVTGVVTGISNGTVVISYSLSASVHQTVVVTVNPIPAAILGLSSVCQGANITLSNSGSGVWSSSNPAVASVPATPGVVSGVSAGVATITFTNSITGCFATKGITVNALPAAISGSSLICLSSSQLFTNSTPGGTWSTGSATIASIGVSTGIAFGNAVGNTNITYTAANGCRATIPVTVSGLPALISGTATLCAGSTTTLNSTTGGQVWSSGNPAIATVATGTATTGIVTGVTAGIAVISYTNANGCSRTYTVTVNPALAPVTGADALCVGGNITLATTSTGGAWAGSANPIATVASGTGVVAGVSAGTVNISYRVNATCYSYKTVTVNAASASAITGSNKVCIGSMVTLSHPYSGGTWAVSNTRASINASGEVTGITAGAFVVTYHTTPGCFNTMTATVNALPANIGGALSTVCEGQSITLTNTTAGGTWSSADASVASVPASPGNVTGVAAGVTNISYTVTSTGCYRTRMVTVNAIPGSISGPSQVCVASTIALSAAPSGGTWSRSSTNVAIDALSGVVTGATAGTSNITYTLPGSCRVTRVVTVYALPAAITGAFTLCQGSATTLTSTTGGQTWSSNDPAVATVATGTATTGIVTGTGIGNATISYTNAAGCSRTVLVTVTPPPAAITGNAAVCIGGTTALASATGGGTWASSVLARATVGLSSGIVTGVSAGTTNITYRTSPQCYVTQTVTVNAQPTDPITGPASVCIGSQISLSHATPGGTWVSSNTLRATVDVNGVVTGLSSGALTITYYSSAGCYNTRSLSVSPAVFPVSGTYTLCEAGGTTALSSATTGGVWSTSNSGIATIHPSTGVVTGVAAGTVSVLYTLGSTGCSSAAVLTVNPVPAAIAGANTICVNEVSPYTNATPGGLWLASAGIIATVASDGNVTGVAAGNVNIIYRLSTGCQTVKPITVNPVPAPITGSATVAELSTVTLNTASTGGQWISSNTGNATVGITTGVVTGVNAGNVIISYQFTSTGCYTTKAMTVNPFGMRNIEGSTVNMNAVIKVYPSPTSGNITVETPTNGTLNVYTIDGKKLRQYNVVAPASAIQLPTNVAAGIYMCHFEGDDGSTVSVRIVYNP